MTNESGTYNYLAKQETVKNIEIFTKKFKRGRMTSDDYIKLVHENLENLTSKRDYSAYLMNIGQHNN
jgi:hypothetical protein